MVWKSELLWNFPMQFPQGRVQGLEWLVQVFTPAECAALRAATDAEVDNEGGAVIRDSRVTESSAVIHRDSL